MTVASAVDEEFEETTRALTASYTFGKNNGVPGV